MMPMLLAARRNALRLAWAALACGLAPTFAHAADLQTHTVTADTAQGRG